MELSKLEMCAIYKMAKAMVLADGVVDPNEVEILGHELRRFGVPITDLKPIEDTANKMTNTDAMAIIKLLPSEQKKYVAAYLGTIMACDGDIDESELKLWKLISTMCDLPTMNITEAIEYLANM